MSIESVIPSNHLILCRPLLLLPSVFPSIRVFPKESVLYIRWPKDWGFSFSISPFSEYSELISFRMDWLDLLAVRGPFRSLLQHHRSRCLLSLWTVKKAECRRIAAFELWCWRRLLRVPWTARKSNQFSSVQFSRSVVSNSLQPHKLQHARSPCPSPTPGVHSDSRPSSQ